MQRGPVQALLVPPVGVSHERLRRHDDEEDYHAQQHCPAALSRSTSSRYPVTSGHGGADDQTGAHAGQVQYPLGYDKAHVEEQVARRQKGEHEEAQGHRDGGGRRRLSAADAGAVRAAATVRPLGTVTITERTVVVVVRRSASVRVTAAGASAGAHGTPGGRRARIQRTRRRAVPPSAGPSQAARGPEGGGDQGGVEEHRFQIPRIKRARYARHGVHRPVEAQRARAEQHSRARRR